MPTSGYRRYVIFIVYSALYRSFTQKSLMLYLYVHGNYLVRQTCLERYIIS